MQISITFSGRSEGGELGGGGPASASAHPAGSAAAPAKRERNLARGARRLRGLAASVLLAVGLGSSSTALADEPAGAGAAPIEEPPPPTEPSDRAPEVADDATAPAAEVPVVAAGHAEVPAAPPAAPDRTGPSAVPVVKGRDEPKHEASRSPFELELHGYGDLQFAFHDYGANQNRPGGSQSDRRLVFDTTRFVFELEGRMPYDLEFEAEVEFEHGGTGVAQELDYEEFGEFEQEVEKGGEVILEEFYLKKKFAKHFSVAAGRFYVAVGLLSDFNHPTDYLAATRSEAETTVIPAVWNEMGLAFKAKFDWLQATAQVVNGLDSTGFSSQSWIATGHQRRFEFVRASDLAFVGRVDLLPTRDVIVGASGYYGGTSRNRPKADLVQECTGGAEDVVAPCGYVDAPVLILDAHTHLRLGPVRASALALWGHLANAGDVSSRNERLSNALNVLRTPVADEALAMWAEVGLDVAPWLSLEPAHRLEPFVRLDHYDTMFHVREGLFDNPRFERTVFTGGVGYTLLDAMVLKLEASRRHFGSSALNPEDTVRLSAAVVY
ncbi:MAG: hypothetical protein OZ921_20165 [Sorangiineae bacterium]|nr:hypothetical protein [Polyangiaceae bacterium]MEB2324841.1 hypothetical protein [Sorangiineae bacterium]